MKLSPGDPLGHYEILAPLGAGGMGEVYRACDPTLEREVAIKVLPADFAADPERLARFEREAKALAALNHPNVATVHGFEQDGDTHFLVMELVYGEDLSERLRRGPIPVEEAVGLFIQIAEGLEAAHEKGIVHRDLKPANVKVTEDGRAKVLDFGLAKAMSAEPSGDADLSQSPTMAASAATSHGVILGTAGYMSPEQARGQSVDKRTDIWSFGCCLFEALAGATAFEGASASDILASILKEEPDWTRLPTGTSPALRRTLSRLLTKDPRTRMRDIGDARLDLAESLDGSSETSGRPATLRSRGAMALLAGGMLLGGALVYALLGFSSGPGGASGSEKTALRYSIRLDGLRPGFLNDDGIVTLSPDGQTLALTAGSGPGARVYLRDRGSLELRPLPGANRAWYKSFSPDSQWLMFGTIGDEVLWRIPRAGGTAVRVAQGTEIFGHSWDGMDHAVFSTPSGLRRVAMDGGEAEIVTETTPGKGFLAHRFPQVLPAGRGVLFTLLSGSGLGESAIAVVHREGLVHRLVEGGVYGRYTSSGHLMYAGEDALYAAPLDLATLEVTASPVRVVEGVGPSANYGVAPYAISEEGTLAYVPQRTVDALRTGLVWVERSGQARRLPFPVDHYSYPRLSPDGRWLAVTASTQVMVLDLTSRRPSIQLTRRGANSSSVWTPDGESVVFISDRDGVWELYRKSVHGTSDPRKLTSEGYAGQELSPSSISPDGVLAIRTDREGLGYDIVTADLEDVEGFEPLIAGRGVVTNAQFSPDGRLVAYETWEDGRPEVFVEPFPPSGEQWQVTSASGRSPVWSESEQELFYIEGTGRMMSVRYEWSQEEFVAAPAEELFRLEIFDPGHGASLFDVSLDGQGFVAVEAQELSRGEVVVIENFFEDLDRLLAR